MIARSLLLILLFPFPRKMTQLFPSILYLLPLFSPLVVHVVIAQIGGKVAEEGKSFFSFGKLFSCQFGRVGHGGGTRKRQQQRRRQQWQHVAWSFSTQGHGEIGREERKINEEIKNDKRGREKEKKCYVLCSPRRTPSFREFANRVAWRKKD